MSTDKLNEMKNDYLKINAAIREKKHQTFTKQLNKKTRNL